MNKELPPKDMKAAYDKFVTMYAEKASTYAMGRALNYVVAMQIVKNTIVMKAGGEAGRRGAIILIESTASMAASQGASVAFQALANPVVGISSAVAEMVAGKVVEALGVSDKRIEVAAGAGASVLAGAMAGAAVGGPIGALAGAGVGAVSVAIGQGIQAMCRIGTGPNDNWAYIETGDIKGKKVCFGSYAGSDKIYWSTYTSEYKRKSGEQAIISAGQGVKASFQLCVWFGGSYKHLDAVFYRDLIHIDVDDKGKGWLIHCAGETNPSAGCVTKFQIN